MASATPPPKILLRAAEIGQAAGLRYIYAGNLPGMVGPWENTRCPQCNETLIRRYGYFIQDYRLTPEGRCPRCSAQIPGRWPAHFEGQITSRPFSPTQTLAVYLQSQVVKLMMLSNRITWGQPPSAVRRAQPRLVNLSEIAGPCEKSDSRLSRLSLLASCSPRDFLTRRLATDLIAASDDSRPRSSSPCRPEPSPTKTTCRPEYLVLQQHGWISATKAPCSPGLAAALLGRSADAIRSGHGPRPGSRQEADKALLFIPVAKRELLGVTGISKQGNAADVDFIGNGRR